MTSTASLVKLLYLFSMRDSQISTAHFATKLCLEWLLSDIWSFVLHFISDSRVTSASWLFEFFKSKMSFKAIAQTSCIPVCSFNNDYLFLLFICHCFFESKIHLFLCGLLLQIRSGLSLVHFFLLFCLFIFVTASLKLINESLLMQFESSEVLKGWLHLVQTIDSL